MGKKKEIRETLENMAESKGMDIFVTSVGELSVVSGYSKRCIRKMINKLERKGIIEVLQADQEIVLGYRGMQITILKRK